MNELLYLAVPAFIGLQLTELWVLARLPHRAHMRGYEARDTAASLTMGVGSVLIGLLLKGVTLGGLAWVSRGRRRLLEWSSGGRSPFWAFLRS